MAVVEVSHACDRRDTITVETDSDRPARKARRHVEEYSRPIPWYVSRRVNLPLPVAARALDRLIRTGPGPGTVGPLRLRDASDPFRPGGARRLHGHLRLGDLGRPVRVELELTGWSHAEAELGLRPLKPVISIRAARYGTTAASTLEELRTELMTHVPATQIADLSLRRAS